MEEPEGRICGACDSWKPADQFWRYPADTRHRGGALFHECRACSARKRRERNRLFPTPAQAARRRRKIRSHGIEPEEYDRMFEAQGGLCALCELPSPDGRWLHIDHDHETGRVRGLLCYFCNGGLGLFHDDADRLRRAIDYLSADSPLGLSRIPIRPKPSQRSTHPWNPKRA